ncbi:haloacid dehalogenase superfamily enzyme, subfamily IA [Leptolyngbyaceae cyanobacterium JSC-12]|nr:haloacid dehalogenase superfamily enzyme, subfamily IA [Leptolyngbyaceae cyanobacterium JSC-12]
MVTIQAGSVRFEQIQAVIFDKDGTLADSQDFLRSLGQKRARLLDAQIPGVQEPLLLAFGMEGDRLHPGGLLAVGTRIENEIAAAAYVAETGRDWIESLEIARSAFIEADQVFKRKADHTPPFEGGLKLLEVLAEREIKVAIASSDSPNHVQDFIERYHLNSLIPFALGSTPDLSKPDPRLVLKLCQDMNVPPAATLVIGDSIADIEMAQAANTAGCLGIAWGQSGMNHLKDANVVVQSFAEIKVLG